MTGSINNMNSQIVHLNDRLNATKKDATDSTGIKEAVDDCKRQLQKIQIDLVAKHNELKRELDAFKKDEMKKELSKESMILETTLNHKLEQMVQKTLKDRTDRILIELKSYTDNKMREYISELEGAADCDGDVQVTQAVGV